MGNQESQSARSAQVDHTGSITDFYENQEGTPHDKEVELLNAQVAALESKLHHHVSSKVSLLERQVTEELSPRTAKQRNSGICGGCFSWLDREKLKQQLSVTKSYADTLSEQKELLTKQHELKRSQYEHSLDLLRLQNQSLQQQLATSKEELQAATPKARQDLFLLPWETAKRPQENGAGEKRQLEEALEACKTANSDLVEQLQAKTIEQQKTQADLEAQTQQMSQLQAQVDARTQQVATLEAQAATPTASKPQSMRFRIPSSNTNQVRLDLEKEVEDLRKKNSVLDKACEEYISENAGLKVELQKKSSPAPESPGRDGPLGRLAVENANLSSALTAKENTIAALQEKLKCMQEEEMEKDLAASLEAQVREHVTRHKSYKEEMDGYHIRLSNAQTHIANQKEEHMNNISQLKTQHTAELESKDASRDADVKFQTVYLQRQHEVLMGSHANAFRSLLNDLEVEIAALQSELAYVKEQQQAPAPVTTIPEDSDEKEALIVGLQAKCKELEAEKASNLETYQEAMSNVTQEDNEQLSELKTQLLSKEACAASLMQERDDLMGEMSVQKDLCAVSERQVKALSDEYATLLKESAEPKDMQLLDKTGPEMNDDDLGALLKSREQEIGALQDEVDAVKGEAAVHRSEWITFKEKLNMLNTELDYSNEEANAEKARIIIGHANRMQEGTVKVEELEEAVSKLKESFASELRSENELLSPKSKLSDRLNQSSMIATLELKCEELRSENDMLSPKSQLSQSSMIAALELQCEELRSENQMLSPKGGTADGETIMMMKVIPTSPTSPTEGETTDERPDSVRESETLALPSSVGSGNVVMSGKSRWAPRTK